MIAFAKECKDGPGAVASRAYIAKGPMTEKAADWLGTKYKDVAVFNSQVRSFRVTRAMALNEKSLQRWVRYSQMKLDAKEAVDFLLSAQ